MTPYAYEVMTNRGDTYLVYANSTEYDNAVMFGYQVEPLAQIEQPHAYQTEYSNGRIHSQSGPLSCASRIADEIKGYVLPVWFGKPVHVVQKDEEDV